MNKISFRTNALTLADLDLSTRIPFGDILDAANDFRHDGQGYDKAGARNEQETAREDETRRRKQNTLVKQHEVLMLSARCLGDDLACLDRMNLGVCESSARTHLQDIEAKAVFPRSSDSVDAESAHERG